MLVDLGTRLGGENGKAPHPASRLERRVAWVEDRCAEAAPQRLLDPLRREPVGAQGFVLDRELVALLVVGAETEAARSASGVACEPDETVERLLGLAPVGAGGVAPDRLDGDVIGRRAAAQREAAVAAACPAGDLARVVQADLQAGLGERERGRTAGHTPADDDRVGTPLDAPLRDRRRGLVEPVAGQRSAFTFASGTKARLPTSLIPFTVL